MAGALKQDFLEAVRLTPDGIAAFLETPLPEAPEVGPADDTANEALAAFLLNVFRPFAGLTPVELLLRIGQHNSVLESAMIAGLEYIEGADSDENSITIIQPGEGIDYAPGEMRFAAIVANGECSGVTLSIGENDPVDMVLNGDKWLQYVDMITGSYAATMTATFEGGGTANATVNFTVADVGQEPPPETPPEPPGGKDDEAIKRARENVLSTYKNLIKAAAETNEIDLVIYFNAFKNAVSAFLSTAQRTSDTIQADMARLTLAVAAFIYNDVKTISSEIMNAVNRIYTDIVG